MTNRIRPFARHEDVHYEMVFTRDDDPGSGYAFPCTKEGTLEPLTPIQQESYDQAIGPGFFPGEVHTIVNRWIDWGSVRCNCGREHDLQRGDSHCVCGQYFNAGGQELLPPDQWED